MSAQYNKLLNLFRTFFQNSFSSDQIELGEMEALLNAIRLTDDEVDDLELLLKRIGEEAKEEEDFVVPDWISNNVQMYLELVDVLGMEVAGRKDLIEHHAALAVAMLKLAKDFKDLEPRNCFISMPSTREQTEQMAERGPGKVKLLSDTIKADLEVILETAKEEVSKSNNGELNNNESSQGEGTVVSRKVLAQRKLDALRKAGNYNEELSKIRDAYDKMKSQTDKEGLAIFKFALKAVAALATAIVVIYGWSFRSGQQPAEPVPVPPQPQQSG
jgi:hypothetical protein